MNFGTESERLRFEGNFKEGKRHGSGVLRKEDEIIVEGEWVDDKYVEDEKPDGQQKDGLDPSKSFEEFDRAFRDSLEKKDSASPQQTPLGQNNIDKYQSQVLDQAFSSTHLITPGCGSFAMPFPSQNICVFVLSNLKHGFSKKYWNLKNQLFSKKDFNRLKKCRLGWFALPFGLKYIVEN